MTSVLGTEKGSLREAALTLLPTNPTELFIDGSFRPARSRATLPTTDPATGGVLADVAEAGEEDVDLAVRAAARAYRDCSWSRITPSTRGAMLWRLADLLEDRAEDFAMVESLDNGKPLSLARGDVQASVEVFRYYAGWAGKIDGRTVQPVSLSGWQGSTRRSPLGVIGQIIPWNFPLNMASWKIAPALAAGNTVVLKPSELTPLTALRLAPLIAEAGFPDGVVNIVPGLGRSAGRALCDHGLVAKVAFTGSLETGQEVGRAALRTMKRVSLELGGKSPTIVLPDADADAAAEGLAAAIFTNQGEVCTAGSRAYIHSSIFDRVAARLEQRARTIRLGDGLDPESEMGPLISASHRKRVHGYVERAEATGATVITGGRPQTGEGNFYPATLVGDAEHASEITQQEVFGPVLVLNSYDREDDMVAAANGTAFGLGAGIWGTDIKHVLNLADRLEAGTVWVNGYHAVDPALPFGGWKASGWGRELGPEALELYTETKTVSISLG